MLRDHRVSGLDTAHACNADPHAASALTTSDAALAGVGVDEHGPFPRLSVVDGVIVRVNAAAERLLGRASGALVGQSFGACLTRDSVLLWESQFLPLLMVRGALDGVFLGASLPSGGEVPMLVAASRRMDGGHVCVEFAMLVARQRVAYEQALEAARDAAEAARLEVVASQGALQHSQAALQWAHDRLKAQAVRDQLTGLLNRRGFADAARQHQAVAERTGAPFLVAALDLDGFKRINDIFGHDVGDEALTEMAVVLTETFRDSDIVARFGGDEFVLLLTNTAATEVDAVRDRLQAALAAHNAEPGRDFALATSVGLAAWSPETPQSLPVLLKAADDAMYVEKRARKSAGAAA